MTRVSLAILLIIPFVASGCGLARYANEVGEARSELREVRVDERQQYRDIERDTRLSTRQYDAERAQLVALSEQACQERQREALRSQIRDSVQSKVVFDMNHAMQVGQLQVDYDKLQKLVAEREKEFKDRQALVDRLNDEAKRQFESEFEDYSREQLRQQLNDPVCGREALNEGCDSCEGACRCGKHKKHFGKHKRPCDKLADFPREPLRQAVRQPILPTEIPLMLPVTLELGMQQPTIEDTRVRREPLRDFRPREPLREPCDSPGSPPCKDNCPNPSAKYRSSPRSTPPVPVADRQQLELRPAGPIGPPPRRPNYSDEAAWQFYPRPAPVQPQPIQPAYNRQAAYVPR
jgi:hypothetical protein